ncbi:MAG: SMP-30/Gluconolaconase/LRE-like region family protein [Burkholderiaceae bacterium]|nr:SMP-30/Gluconolaconase/LRE-like region family protein [Burkholderiaceae bacterium]
MSPTQLKLKTILSLGAATLAFALVGCAHTPNPATHSTVIEFTGETIYPESAFWSAKQNRFFIGSVRHGDIGTVDTQGHYQAFIRSQSTPSTFGIHIDDKRNHLWVTIDDLGTSDKSSPTTQGKLAAVAQYDSKTGQQLGYWDVTPLTAGAHVANDIALDDVGNAYITDSFANVIYCIDTQGQISVFADSPLFKTGASFGLNGIAYHSDGYLLVGAWNSGELFKVNINQPQNVRKVALPETLAGKGMDGIALLDANHLIAAVSFENRTVSIESTDDWNTAQLIASQPTISTYPSAVAIKNAQAWTLNSRLDSLLDPKASKVNSFMLQKFQPTLGQ